MIVLGVVLIFVLVALFAVVNSIEIAIVSVNRIRVRHLAEEGRGAAEAIERLLANRNRFFAAIVIFQNMLVFFAATIGGLVAADIAGTGAAFIAAVVLAVFTALAGEFLPKGLAAQGSERFALLVARPAELLTNLMTPIAVPLSGLLDVLSRAVLGRGISTGPSITEAELRMLIGMSAEAGSVAEEEAELLDRVFHFGDRRVHEVMVPRTEVVWLEKGTTVREFYQVYAQTPHSRFPVYEGSPDSVIGVVGIKDILLGTARGTLHEDDPVDKLLRGAYFVPESKAVGELFREMQANGVQMAAAVDEYGGTAGIVTLELLLEEMVGEVRDELRPEEEEEIRPIGEGAVQVDGSLGVAEAREELGIDIPEGPYDTIAGYVLSRLGHIPREGESITEDGTRITVAVMKGPKIELLRVTRA